MFKNIKFINKVRGQALLITIMLVSVALTVVLAMSYTAKTDLQLSKLEEENQKALAAAEAGIEALVNLPSDNAILNINTLENTDLRKLITGAKKISITGREFVSPLIQESSQYTQYLSSYPGFINSYEGILRVYYSQGGDTCNENAIEIKIIYGNSPDYKIRTFVSDKNNLLHGGLANPDNIYDSTASFLIGEENFKCKTKDIDINAGAYPGVKIMIVRPIFKSTKIGFQGSTNLPSQGSVIESTAETPSGVSKKIQLFQSNPQIPAEFFVTSF